MLPFSWLNSNNLFSSMNFPSSTMSKAAPTPRNIKDSASISLNNILDRKIRKPLVEKERRETINRALDEMKKILLESKLQHESTLMKAEVATQSAKYMREQQNIIEKLQKENDELKQSLAAAATKSSIPNMTNQIPKLPSQPATFNPLMFTPPNLLMTQFLLFQQLQQNATTKLPSTPLLSPPATAGASNGAVSTLSNPPPTASSPPFPSTDQTKSDLKFDDGSSSSEIDTDDGEGDTIDVEKLDDDEEHDETFSPPITPKINSRKRSRSPAAESWDTVTPAAEEENDSGIFDGPSPPKKKKATTTPASFGVNDLLK